MKLSKINAHKAVSVAVSALRLAAGLTTDPIADRAFESVAGFLEDLDAALSSASDGGRRLTQTELESMLAKVRDTWIAP